MIYREGLNLSLLNKKELFEQGMIVCDEFLSKNNIKPPIIIAKNFDNNVKEKGCYYYHDKIIHVNFSKCRLPVKTPGYSWTYPGYKADLTPMGVLAHEMGHHIDNLNNLYKLMPKTPKVSGYEPNDKEIVAETLRLFILNPDLLRIISFNRYKFLNERFVPVITQTWEEVLVNAHIKFKNTINKNFIK